VFVTAKKTLMARLHHLVPIDSDKFLCLKPCKVAGDQLSHRANLCRQFLVARMERETQSALILCLSQNPGDQAMANGGERQFLNDSNQPAKPRARHFKHFERDFRKLHAERPKILARYE